MGGFKRVTNTNRCPICGKPDWCFWRPMNNYDGMLLYCQRHTVDEDVSGLDGNYYIHIGFSDGENSRGISIFEEATQRMQRIEEYKQERTATAKPKTEIKQLTPVSMVYAADAGKLHKIYSAILDLLKLEPEHKEYLMQEGWTDELIKKHRIVSFPEKDYSRFLYRKESFKNGNLSRKKLALLLEERFGKDCLVGVPGAYKDTSGAWTFAGRSGILFPMYDVQHRIYRLRIRLDFRDVDGKIEQDRDDIFYLNNNGTKVFISMKGLYTLDVNGNKNFDKGSGKYRNFASFKQDDEATKQGFLMNKYFMGCEAGNQLAFYCNEERDDMYIAYITEGEKKGIYGNDSLRAPFISLPGVNSWGLLFKGKIGERPIDVLKKKGVKILVIAFDADKSINARVLQAQESVIKALKEEGFLIGIAEWDINIGKGIDDLLAAGGKPNYVLAFA